jgi:hypothetical protein
MVIAVCRAEINRKKTRFSKQRPGITIIEAQLQNRPIKNIDTQRHENGAPQTTSSDDNEASTQNRFIDRILMIQACAQQMGQNGGERKQRTGDEKATIPSSYGHDGCGTN